METPNKETIEAIEAAERGEGKTFDSVESMLKELDQLSIEEKKDKLVIAIKKYVEGTGAAGVVVGLSGGIDSALVACLMVESLGAENVMGVIMPCRSNPQAAIDGEELAKNLGIDYEIVDLEKAFAAFEDTMEVAFGDLKSLPQLTLPNIKSRLRMVTLYAFAGTMGRLVAGTTNASEMVVGYYTKYGDGGIDFEPIATLFKNEVYEMAKLYDDVPMSTLTKAPSADLFDAQTDESEMGFTYDQLEAAVCQHWGLPKRKDLEPVGQDIIDKVVNMYNKTEHKRNTPPVIEI